ncbi:MAG: RecQ family ATP-dependent DNA helicase [Akkermansia sp.]|nr:RecQ family ATP-dependent DNA helicase [Akkermansia sp.]MBQ8376335.1 RecQ family ATP-dependent DNA helicase [Akkermansia sp.]
MAAFREIPDTQQALKTFFGFEELRPGQAEVVQAIMAGQDAMGIMPTGGGKSLCYQLPALCREGLTVVVSPLIALMKDQVDALQARGIPAAAVNSSLGAEEYRQVMQALRQGELKIIYVAPERFAQESFMSLLRGLQISLLAVDEAHCLSQWGHDFRPDYLRLGRVREALGYPQTVALTATATEHVREDILGTLQLREPAVVISGFARDNLDFGITHCESRKAKFERILKVVARWKTGIIYCSTRKNVMLVFEELSSQHLNVVAYHAGMTDEEREFSQNAFVSGRADVVVATNAFGMGIDRSDVRFVVHFEIPGSVEAYYQEAGRAGRDGNPAVCELLFNHADLKTQEFFFEGSNPPVTLIRALYNFLRFESDPTTHELHITVDAMAERMGKEVNPMAVGTALSCLIHAGAIQRFDVPGQLTKGTRLLKPELNFECLDIDRAALEEKARRDHLKIESMTRFAYSMGCRQQWILDYFGETGAEPCGHCDVCAASGSNEREEVSGDDLLTVRKALAGVARASKRGAEGEWVAIYGRGKIMDMLRGARNASMHQYLTSLSTYGILKNLTDAKMKALFRAMHEAGLLQSTGGDMPLITLTPQGEEVMQSRAVPRLSLRTWSSAARRPAPAVKRDKTQQLLQSMGLGRLDKELYEHLAELRRDLAAEFNMPAYRIMHNDTLRAMATVKPTTMEAAERLKGVGPWLRTHGLRAFVELIQDYEEC